MYLESLGVPVGVLSTETYEVNQFIGAQDKGIARVRRIVQCDIRRANYLTAPLPSHTMANGCLPIPAGSNTSRLNQYHSEQCMLENREQGGRVAAMIAHFSEPPLSPIKLQRLDPVNPRAYANSYNNYPEYMAIADDHWSMSALPVIDQAMWAAIGPLTEADKNPPPIRPSELGCLNDGLLGPAKEITFTAPTRGEAIQQFMDFAKEHRFGDGLALIPPTPELVNEMLANTTRDRNDILGRMYLRGGAITIENLAINAVMSGVKPEAFPVIVAMGEALGHGWEEAQPWWHIMTGNTNELAMIVSGPVVNELGMSTGVGQ
ncbi:MAG: hypothetical protein LBH28_05085, partial [Oscillospiraceae bacterium]|nr:hypothetical protein [Oscillospiraceae bacterium]